MLTPTGASGTGRTTFVNTLVEQPLLQHRAQQLLRDPDNTRSDVDPVLAEQAATDAHVERPIQIKPTNVELDEDGVRIALTVVDTPGFGDGIDSEHWCVERRVGARVGARATKSAGLFDATYRN